MTAGQKASVSLLIAVLLFAAFAVAAFSGLFNVIDSSFRNPALTRGFESSLAKVAQAEADFHAANLARFSSVLAQDSVRRSFLPNQSSQDVFDRTNLLGKLQEETVGLSGLRLIDANGKRIHFSTIPGDVVSKTQLETVYRFYGAIGDLPYDGISAPEGSKGVVRVDSDSGRFLYSLPFSDSFGLYRGTAVFQVSLDALVSLLVKEGLAPVGESATPAGGEGILLRVPLAFRSALPPKVAELWASGLGEKPVTIATSNSTGESFVLFSHKVEGSGRVGYIISAGEFVLPRAMKWILLASFFVTAYLLAFLLLNLRQDPMTVLSDRIKRFQIALLEEYVDNKSEMDFGRWRRELEARRLEVRTKIRSSVGKVRKNKRAEVDELIDKSWDEILEVLGGRPESERGGIGVKEMERLLGEALKNGSFVLPAAIAAGPAAIAAGPSPRPTAPGAAPQARAAAPASAPRSAAPSEPAEAVEELEEAESVEELEAEAPAEQFAEGEPVQPASSRSQAPQELEELEELEELGDLEEIESAEEVPATVESAEAVPANIEAAEAVDELEAAESVEELEAEEAEAQFAEGEPELGEAEGLEAPEETKIAQRGGLQPVTVRYAHELAGEPSELEELEPLDEVVDEAAAEPISVVAAEPFAEEAIEAEIEAAEAQASFAAPLPAETDELGAFQDLDIGLGAGPAALPTDAARGIEAASQPQAELASGLQAGEELEELEVIEDEGRLALTEAYELAAAEREDIPLIPESSGLELAEEVDIADIIGFVDVEDADEAEELEELEELEEISEAEELEAFAEEGAEASYAEAGPEGPISVSPLSLGPDEGIEDEAGLKAFEAASVEGEVVAGSGSTIVAELAGVPGASGLGESSGASGLEPLEEVEFELLLSSIDLSSLEQWDRGPAGAAEADATRFEASDELELENLIPAQALQPSPPEAPASAIAGATVPEAEAFAEAELEPEELEPLPESIDENAAELGRYLGPWIGYRPFAAYERPRATEELPVVGEGDPWSEAEFLGGYLEMEEEEGEPSQPEGGIIEYRDGVFRLNANLGAEASPEGEGRAEDPELRALVDSVLSPGQRG